jgi:hypothetical protein
MITLVGSTVPGCRSRQAQGLGGCAKRSRQAPQDQPGVCLPHSERDRPERGCSRMRSLDATQPPHPQLSSGAIMKSVLSSWQLWALLSAGFAALTAIFAKVGYRARQLGFCHLHPHHRHPAGARGHSGWHRPVATARLRVRTQLSVSGSLRARHRWIVDLLFPGTEARGCSACCAHR